MIYEWMIQDFKGMHAHLAKVSSSKKVIPLEGLLHQWRSKRKMFGDFK